MVYCLYIPIVFYLRIKPQIVLPTNFKYINCFVFIYKITNCIVFIHVVKWSYPSWTQIKLFSIDSLL